VFLAVGTELALRAALLAAQGKPIVLLAIDFDPVARGVRGERSPPITGVMGSSRVDQAFASIGRASLHLLARQPTELLPLR
jgi:hypothetical protein